MPSAADLAETIKSLKAANTIEANTERLRKKQSTAEEPVTTLIRRKATLATTTVTQSGSASSASTDLQPESSENSPTKPMTFKDRMLSRRTDDDSTLPPL